MGFGTSSSPSAATPILTGIPIQTASSIVPVALSYGLSRAAGNLWDYTDFTAHQVQSPGAKGFGGSSAPSYTYSATVIVGLCEGPIDGIGKAWNSDGSETTLAALGFTLFTGTMPQAAWGYMTGAHPDHAEGYNGEAYLAQANLDLGSSATLPNYNFEIEGNFHATQVGGAGDADPALMIQDYLTNADHGVGVPASLIDAAALLSGPDAATPGDSAFQTWCQAMGFGLSVTLSSQEAAAGVIDRWCLLTSVAPVWTGFALKFVPYGDQPVTGNGVTWLPPTAALFELTDDDYIQNADKDPIEAARSDPRGASNVVKFNIRDRANAYNPVPVTWQEDNAIALYGRIEAGAVDANEVCDLAMGGAMVSLYGQRVLFIRNQYSFTLGPRWDLLEPMDCGTISDPILGLTIPCRIVEIAEGAEGLLAVIAEHFSGALGSPPSLLGAGGATPDVINRLASGGPVNPPILFEPPADLAQTLFGSPAPRVAAAVSGGDGTTADPLWGGAQVWVSTDDVTYAPVGKVQGPARMGVSTAALAAYGGANPDTADTLSVDLSESGGVLTGVSAADAARASSLCRIDDEYLSFRDATLTGPHAYDLGGELYRGLYGSTPGSHLTDVAFARLDAALFSYLLPASYVGIPLWFKFQSYNIWGNALEDLSGVTAYTFTPAGTGFGGGTGGVPTAPTGLAATAAADTAAMTWAANPASDTVTAYRLSRAAGTGASFGSASVVWTGLALGYTDGGLIPSTGYTYFLEAMNAVGASGATAGEDATTTAFAVGINPFGFSYSIAAGSITPSQPFARFNPGIAWTLPTGLPNARGEIDTAPTAQTDFDIQTGGAIVSNVLVGGTSVGTMRFAASATSATFIKAADTAVAAGVAVTIVPPSNLNGMSGLLDFAITGTR